MKYSNLLKDTEYIKIFWANLISDFGNSVDNIAFSWLVYQITQSPLWVSIIYGASFVPRIFLGPLFGAFVENRSKKNVLVLCDVLGVLLTAGMIVLYFMNLLNPWSLLIFTCVNASIESMRSPAGMAILPKLLSEENFSLGASLSQSSRSIVELLGLGITGFIIASFGIVFALIIDSVSFLLSLLLILSIKCNETLSQAKEQFKLNEFISSLKEGIAYLYQNKIMVFIVWFAAYINFIGAILNAYLPIYVTDYLCEGAEIYSLLSVIISIGLVCGGIFTPLFHEKISVRQSFLTLSYFFAVTYFIMIFILNVQIPFAKIGILCILFLCFGLISAFVNIKISISFLEKVQGEYMARVSSVLTSLACMMIPLSSLILSILSLYIDVAESFILYGCIGVAVSLFISFRVKFVK